MHVLRIAVTGDSIGKTDPVLFFAPSLLPFMILFLEGMRRSAFDGSTRTLMRKSKDLAISEV